MGFADFQKDLLLTDLKAFTSEHQLVFVAFYNHQRETGV